MKIDRLLAVVLLLLNRRKITAQELSERFQVSVRTVYRDIDTIDAAGIPIISHQGQGGGFSIVDSYRLEKQLLSPEEIMTLVSVLSGVGQALGDKHVIRSRQKMASLVPQNSNVGILDEVRIELSPWAYRGGQDALLSILRKATQRRVVVRFAYRNTKGEICERSVEPMTLVFKGSAWYLFGYCRVRKDFRLFRLSRIRELRVTEEVFERRPEGYDTFTAKVDSRPIEMADCEIKFSPKVRFMAEDWFEPRCIEANANGGVTVKASLPIEDWLQSWLLSLGDQVEVVKPARLRKMLKQAAVAISKLYDR